MTCDDCGRIFGGQFAFDWHVDRRKDRCRPDRELRRRLHQRRDGVWVQRTSFNRQLRFPGMPRTLWGTLTGTRRRAS